VSFVSKVKIELAIEVSMLDRVIEAIRTSGLSGQIGDGKIFISAVERAVRIGTGETGQAALRRRAPDPFRQFQSKKQESPLSH